MTFDQATQALIKRAQLVGLKSFVIGAMTSEKEVGIRFENINMQNALKIFIAGIYQSIQVELRNHPEFSDERVAVFAAFGKDLETILDKFNKAYSQTKN